MLFSLVSEWTFDDGTNQAVNRIATADDVKDSWGSNHGTVHGNPQVKGGDDCIFGRCLSFDGDDHIVIDMFVSGTEATISLWVKNPSGSYVLRSDANCRTYVRRNSFSKGDPLVSLGSASYSKDWNHAVITWKKENGQLKGKAFINGVPTQKDFKDFSDECNGTYITLMSFTRGGEQFASGTIDDVRYYNAVLSTAEIKQNYIAGLDLMLKNGSLSKNEYNQRLQALANN